MERVPEEVVEAGTIATFRNHLDRYSDRIGLGLDRYIDTFGDMG